MKIPFLILAACTWFSSFSQESQKEPIVVESELDQVGLDSIHIKTIEAMFTLDEQDLRDQFHFILESKKFSGEFIGEFVRLSVLSASNLDIVMDQLVLHQYHYDALRPYELLNFPILNVISKDQILKKSLVEYLITSDYLMDCEILSTNNKKVGQTPLHLTWTEIVALSVLDKATFPLYQKNSCRVDNLNKIREAGAKVLEQK